MRILAACANCKTQYDVSGQKPNDTLRCRCGATIVVPEPRVQDARLVRCASCGGSRGARFELTDAEAVKYIPCPDCKSLMNRRNFAGVSGVIIDTCKNCGVWLDNQELNRIVRFIEAGGMDRAREVQDRDRAHSE